MLMAVSYLYIEGNTSTSKIVFYNFGNVGQNQTDNIVKEIEYPNLLFRRLNIWITVRLWPSGKMDFRYMKGQIPDEDRSVEIDDEIISAFHDDSCVLSFFTAGWREQIYDAGLWHEWTCPI